MALRLDMGTPDTRRFVTYIILAILAIYSWGIRTAVVFELDKIIIPVVNLTLGQVYALFLVLIMWWIRTKAI